MADLIIPPVLRRENHEI